MANQVSGTKGHNWYWRNDDGTFSKLSADVIGQGANFTQGALDPDTYYGDRIYIAPIDNAGNELLPPVAIDTIPGGELARTLNPTPEQALMSAADRAAIDNILTRCIAAGAGPSVTAAVVCPKGHYEVTKGEAGGTGVNLYYRLASQTKSFLAYTIMMALDQGLIGSLDDTIDQYVAGIPNGNLMTLKHMLMMRSGIYDYTSDQTFGLQFYLNPQMAMSVDQIIAKIKAGAPMFSPPGTGYQYTNSNYYILAKAREAVDPQHRTIDRIMAEDIWLPLGMVNTYLQLGTGGLRSPFSPGYALNFLLSLIGIKLRQDVTAQNSSLIWASGAGVSVVGDMLKWCAEMRDGTLISPESYHLLRTTFEEYASVPRYGLAFNGPATFGYGLGRIKSGSLEGIDGSWLGHDSCSLFEPQTGMLITVYENFQTTSPHVLAALSTVAYEIAEYLYPGSGSQPGYMTGEPGLGEIATRIGPIRTSMTGTVYEPGQFQPFTETNLTKVDEPIPVGAQFAVITKLRGAGGPGGNGTSVYNSSGGSGGGSAGKVDEVRIPVSELGATYTTIQGLPNGVGQPGGDSVFRSGGVELIARGGGPGYCTTAYNATAAGGAPGGWSATPATIDGVAVTGASGVPGANSHMQGGQPGQSGAAKDVGGSGAGGQGSYGGLSGGVQPGGSSATVAGTTGAGGDAPGTDDEGTDAGAGGGQGQPGGKYGAGGGGGRSYGNVAGQPGQPGSPGVVQVRWE